MILRNLLRRKGRTFLTILGIAIGVAAIIGLGAMADGIDSGYNAMLSGSQADLVLSQPNSFDISYSSVDETIGGELVIMPEASAVSGMLEGYVATDGVPFFFVFGYPEDSFILDRFQITSGFSIANQEAQRIHKKRLMLGSIAAETLKKKAGDTIRLGNSMYQILGIYQTGDAFEDAGAVLALSDAQEILGKPRQVSLFYIQLKDPELRDRFAYRVGRRWPDLDLSRTSDFADKQMFGDMLNGFVYAIGGLAILIGGVGMMNAQLMSVYERTREIGVLRALGWSSLRVLLMILGESLIVCFAGGLLGIGLGKLALSTFSSLPSIFGATNEISTRLLLNVFLIVFTIGIIAGLYPAWRASRLQPVEALRYEGGSGGGHVRRLPVGGMAIQSLWQRTTRTLLTLSAIGITVGAIMALEGVLRGTASSMTDLATGSGVEIMVRQADVADTELSAIDERIGEKIGALTEVESVSGIIFTAVTLTEPNSFFILFGYGPNEYAIRRFSIVEGERITGNHQIMIGRMMSEILNKGVGDTIELSGTRFRIVGIYETGLGWEELGGVGSLRDVQTLAGRPHKVSMYAVKVQNPRQAEKVVQVINNEMDEAHASLSGEFVDQMPDMENMDAMLNGISFLAILVGGVGVLNTMLMAVLERTREIGVLRSLGWQRRSILWLILQEAFLIGVCGAIAGIGIALGLTSLMAKIPMYGEALIIKFSFDLVARAILVALLLGVLGGLYPAYRATRLEPVEALRYE